MATNYGDLVMREKSNELDGVKYRPYFIGI